MCVHVGLTDIYPAILLITRKVDLLIPFLILDAGDDGLVLIEESADTKMAATGYWYNGHDALDRLQTIVKFGVDSFGVQTQKIEKVSTRFRIGDLPNRYLYRQNTLLEADRTRGEVSPTSP